MKTAVVSSFDKLTGLVYAYMPPKRLVNVLEEDIFLVSYPKSGNTWLRFIVANLVNSTADVSFSTIDSIVPDIYKVSAIRLRQMSKPRILKSHEYLDIRYRKVIYIARDPRDVLLSYYHYKILRKKLSETHPLDSFAQDFLDGKLDKFGTWQDHVGGWLGARGNSKNFLFLRYEDLIKDPLIETRKVAEFIGLSVSDDTIQKSLELSSFKKMRELEKSTGSTSAALRGSRKDMFFVREGRSGGWVESLPEAVSAKVIEKFQSAMTQAGYLETSSGAQLIEP